MSRSLALVVEDDPDIQQLLARHVARAGARVSMVGSGEEALRVLAVERPDLVLLDLCLPGIDGWEVLRWMRAQRRLAQVPVLVVSILEVEDAEALEVDGWVVKPFSGAMVVEEVRRLLGVSPAVPA
jgi:DNA-binding response OmpR family regulator